jgi:post-segregation antitoxin (ccd killing protein)
MRTVERVSVSAFVDPDDHERLVERARAEDRSVSAELRVAIREHLEHREVDRYLDHARPTVGRIREPSS